jgi:hypothetical protein
MLQYSPVSPVMMDVDRADRKKSRALQQSVVTGNASRHDGTTNK